MPPPNTEPRAAERPLPSSEAGVAFLQRRVGLFGLTGFALGGTFFVFRVIVSLATSEPDFLLHPSMILHLAGSLMLLASWALCRTGAWPRRSVETLESTSLLASAAAYAGMGYFIPAIAQPEMIMLLAMTLAVMARAVLVPSAPKRTALLTALVGVPIAIVGYFVHASSSQVLPSPLLQDGYTPAAVATSTAVWWLLTTVLATVTSQVIYGLRQEIRQARRLGQYSLEKKLGEGGMGVVYRASHAMLRRPAAVKLLPAARAGEQAIARFEREVQLTAGLTHPNTVTVFDYGRTPDGIFYYAMEMLDGATVEEIVEHDGPQPASRVLHVLVAMAGALAEAHDIGLIHRDIKPANVMLCRHGGDVDVPKLLDFGLVKDLEASHSLSLTSTNTITGTPLYMAPEAILSPREVDARSDLYALGAVGYFMLTGTHVFDGDSVVEVCGRHLHEAPEPPVERVGKPVPQDLSDLLLACLAKQPKDRPQNARELKQRLLACVPSSPWGNEQACAWWEANTPWLKGRAGEEPSTPEMTIDVEPNRTGCRASS
jgi:hypothetical protein